MASVVIYGRGYGQPFPSRYGDQDVELVLVDRRKEYMMLLIILSRVDVDACAPFLEGIPAEAVHAPDHQWWTTPDRDDLLEAMARTIDVLRG